ncbi:MAG: proline--tRNA ligase [bacterium]|nr:proline--tRNA ligase [bacterium]
MAKAEEHAISPTRADDYPEWYQQVVKAADLAEISVVRGCMVIKPWGYGIWEGIQRDLDRRFKETGHENAYFPLLIPLSLLQKEAEHVEKFAKECAVVTHHRLEVKDGKIVPAESAKLEEPLIIRPTSETIIGESFSKWVESYRDLPILINQWANVLRWEMRTRVFLRTAEFLWQEGHTCHASENEAMEETMKMLDVYSDFAQDVLAMPVIKGEKTAGERFPGAVRTFCIEAMMQDRKALQAGTSHYLGQNFAKSSNIKFLNEKGEIEHAYTTSWGVSTRLIGGLVMTHSDDDGLRVPPRVAPKHVAILPIIPKDETKASVLEYADKISSSLKNVLYADEKVRVTIDKRDMRGGEKSWSWIKRGVPVRIEAGPRDIESQSVVVMRRDKGHKEKEFVKLSELPARLPIILAEIQKNLYDQAAANLKANTTDIIKTWDELVFYLKPKSEDKPEIHGGFVMAKWSGEPGIEEKLAEIKATARCMPLIQSGTEGKCILSGKKATTDLIIAKAY